MPNSLKFRAITANCGNDTLGKKASAKIINGLKVEQLDFIIINCQEGNFKGIQKQLNKALGANAAYRVKCLGKMSTHTKLGEQFHRNTGLASFIFYKNELTINEEQPIKARRTTSRFGGAGFNKGGLVINFTITDASQQNTRLQTVSGHLDSSNLSKRTRDWATIHAAVAKDKVASWNELVWAMPNIKLAGYDANTRNKYIDEQLPPVNLWEEDVVPQELKALKQAPLGGLHFSTPSTYKTFQDNIQTTPDPKRPGYAMGGMLDFVDIAADTNKSPSSAIVTEEVFSMGAEPGTKRDHDVIGSPIQIYSQKNLSEFERVKAQMIAQLYSCAPDVVKELEEFKIGDEKKLCDIYNYYLSKNGFVIKQIELQADLLGNLDKISKINVNISNKIAALLLTDKAWFTASVDNIKIRQEFESLVSDILDSCTSEPDLDEVYNVLHTSQNSSGLKKQEEIKLTSSNRVLQDMHNRCMKQVDELLHQIHLSQTLSPEKKENFITQATLKFTTEIHTELKLLDKLNVSEREGARSMLLKMLKLLTILMRNLNNLTGFFSQKSRMASKAFKNLVKNQKNETKHVDGSSPLLKQ